MMREYAIEWHVERIADKVSALASTHELHKPPTNDAEQDLLDDTEEESDKLRFNPNTTLYFEVTSDRSFQATLDDDGPLIHVVFNKRMTRAVVTYGEQSPVTCSADAHDVASVILGLEP